MSESTNIVTLTSWTLKQKATDKELALLMNAIQLSCKFIARAVRKAGIAGLYGMAGDINASGDDVKKLDVISNDIMVSALLDSHSCAVLVSEENAEPIIVEAKKSGPYCVAFDPLDGSSNIDCNVSTGTIFSVLRRKTPSRRDPCRHGESCEPCKTEAEEAMAYESSPMNAQGALDDVLRPGNEMVCAGYCMYGSATDFVVTFGDGTHRFTLDDTLGEFIYIDQLKFPPDDQCKKIYSVNEGNTQLWDENMQQAIAKFRSGPKPYTGRYVGSMVSDVHRTILYGGIFLYPADKKSPKGKLRLLYEGYPMAMLTEQAGGTASTGMFKGKVQRILDLVPENIHDRCPIIMGCNRDCKELLSIYS